MQRGPDVLGDADALIGAPEEAAAEEGGEEEEAVVPLGAGAGHVEFVEEPVEVEEGGGDFIEDEGWAVEVYERSLLIVSSLVSVIRSLVLELSRQKRRSVRIERKGGKETYESQ